MSKINYEKIRRDNIKEYGEGTRHLSYFADIYSTRTHFIFEILQNAEDALKENALTRHQKSGYVHFNLCSDKLEIRHNGKPFDEKNVKGICGIGEGTKAGDYTQIGKFGIGFKSVYAYSFFPEIHSENEHFKIERFVEPHAIEAITSKDTLIVLPFDQPEKRPEWAFRDNVNADSAVSEISLAISKLNIRTLLFLQQIEKIEWNLPDGNIGFLTKKIKSKNKKANSRIVEVSDHLGKIEQWQIFAKEIDVTEGDKKHQATIEIAFLLEKGKVIKANDTELVISFPTEKKTELGFLIQAPFKATKSRDNIKSDDAVNHQMINTAAQLVADSLLILRDSKKLNIASYNALPLNENNFPENSFFRPVYCQVREALKTQALLPAQGGAFITANKAKLANVKRLVELFSLEQLGVLFDKQQLFWLDASITESGIYKDIYDYLKHLVSDIEVSVDNKLTSKLTADFFSKQSINWLIQFILYAETNNALKNLPFVRLQSGEQVALTKKRDSKPIAYFLPKQTEKLDLSALPLVHAELAANELVKTFLEKENVGDVGAKAIIELRLKHYQSPTLQIDDSHYDDIKQFINYWNKNQAEKTLFQNSSFLIADVLDGKPDWKRPTQLCLDNPFIETGLAELVEIHQKKVIWQRYSEKLNENELKDFVEFSKAIGVVHKLEITLVPLYKNPKWYSELSKHCEKYKGVTESRTNCIEYDYSIAELELYLKNLSVSCSLLIWNALIKAELKVAKAGYRINSKHPLCEADSQLISYLKNHAWIPNINGGFFKPQDMTSEYLCKGFSFDKGYVLLTAIEFGKEAEALSRQAQQANSAYQAKNTKAQELGFKDAEQAERLARLMEEKGLTIDEIENKFSPKNDIELPTNPVRNTDRRRTGVLKHRENAPSKESIARERFVQSGVTEDTVIMAKAYLRAIYENIDKQLICQLCQKEMPFKIKETYYFEAVQCVRSVDKHYYENRLALCPTCAARYKHARDTTCDEMTKLIIECDAPETTPSVEIPIKVTGENYSLYFVGTHWFDLKTVLEKPEAVNIES